MWMNLPERELERSILGRGNSKGKGPEVRKYIWGTGSRFEWPQWGKQGKEVYGTSSER